MIRRLIEKIQNKSNLTLSEIEEVMAAIMIGEASEAEMTGFLLALEEKGLTVEEITGAAGILREHSLKVETHHKDILDTCGTGGDRKCTFNISTLVALVVAGAGAIVAKHGNRSVSSQCGSADVLEALGVNLELDPKAMGQCLDEVGVAFLFAQKLHPAMKNVAAVRRSLGRKTIFNILGPLINPARATHQMMGVYSRELVEPITMVLGNLGLKKALVVHGYDGLDEVTTTGKTFIGEWDGKEANFYDFDPLEMGFEIVRIEDLVAPNLSQSVQIFQNVLLGHPGPQKEIVVLNSAFALYAAEKVSSLKDGIRMAEESLNMGRAQKALESLVAFTRHAKI